MSATPETKAEAEALIPQFRLERVLNQDQNGRRINLLGSIKDRPALLTLERAAFPSPAAPLQTLLSRLAGVTNLGANDIYRWYLAGTAATTSGSDRGGADLKLNLIYPCTAKHVAKYSSQRLRYVTETPALYAQHVRPYIERQRTAGRLDWIFNVLDGRTEQDDVVLRADWDAAAGSDGGGDGFLLLPDLNWDRTTATSLHLLALVQRRDIWSLRDLRKAHVPWLRRLQARVLDAAAATATSIAAGAAPAERDEFKCYVHYHPTYYHFHVHVVHVLLEPEGGTQNVGKAWDLGGLIAWLDSMAGGPEAGLDGVDFAYAVGEESDLWKGLWARLKAGHDVALA